MFCHKCGNKVTEEADFCHKLGRSAFSHIVMTFTAIVLPVIYDVIALIVMSEARGLLK